MRLLGRVGDHVWGLFGTSSTAGPTLTVGQVVASSSCVTADETIFPTLQVTGASSGSDEQFAHQLTARRVNLVRWPETRFGCSPWPITVRFDRSL
jgi:hypothetical protein